MDQTAIHIHSRQYYRKGTMAKINRYIDRFMLYRKDEFEREDKTRAKTTTNNAPKLPTQCMYELLQSIAGGLK